MRVFVNHKVRTLFIQIALCMAAAVLLSALPVVLGAVGGWPMEAVTHVSIMTAPVFVSLTGVVVLYVCYQYFRQQDSLMEEAVTQIREFISGDRDARIVCDEEGELYRLFHEVNSLAAILNAQVQKEGQSKAFLKTPARITD